MTPQEKAKDLLLTFSILETGQNDLVKQCTLICVDEIIEALIITTGHCNLNKLDRQEIQMDFNYWNEVRKEIEKL